MTVMNRFLTETRLDEATPPIVLLGAGGHGRVVLDMVKACGGRLAAVVDPAEQLAPVFAGCVHVSDDADLSTHFTPADCVLLNGLGMMPGAGGRRRKFLYLQFVGAGYRFLTLIHPSAVVSPTASLGQGAQVMAGAVVQCGAYIGSNAIINTRASVDHDSRVGDHAHVAPGAVLCGGVGVGEGVLVGAGAVLLPGDEIAPGEVVPAGEIRKPRRQ